jgi:hypothetical protein
MPEERSIAQRASVRSLLALAGASAVCLLGVAASAGAATVRCRTGFYDPGLNGPNTFPTVSRLRAVDLPRLTDGYAPRCLVAESIAGRIQTSFDRRGRLPRTLHIYGARWDGGRWRLS